MDVVVTTIDQSAAEEVGTALEGTTDEPIVAQRRGIDGATLEWMVLAGATLPGLSSLLTVLVKLVKDRRVARIKIGDFEYENPRPEDLPRLMDLAEKRLRIETAPEA